MVSVGESHSRVHSIYSFHSPSSNSSTRIWREKGRSMRTVRSNLIFSGDCSIADLPSDNLTDSFVDLHLGHLASKTNQPLPDFLSLSHSSTDCSLCSSDISGELHRLATITPTAESANTEITSSDSLSDSFSADQPTINLCIDGLQSPSLTLKRSAAAKIRLLAKNRSDNRVLIAQSGAIPALIPLLRCSDPWTQEHSVTALLNLSLHPDNRALIAEAGAVKALIYVLKTGTETSKQNAAAALMSLAMVDDNRLSIGACGAIPPLVSLLINGSSRGKKDAMTTLYKLCSVNLNKERAVSAGVVKPLIHLGAEPGMAEKAMVVLSSLAAIQEGKKAIVDEGGLAKLVEAVEDGSDKGKEFAVFTLLLLCTDDINNRGLLVREGGIPPLVALSQTATPRAKHKAETLLGYLRELRQEASSSSSP